MKSKKGITLVALIITIIVMVILAGVAISMVAGNDGVVSQSENATQKQNYAVAEEKIRTQSEFITQGENAGKIDLAKTEDNINDLGLNEIKEIKSTETLLTIVLNDGSEVKIEGINGENPNQLNKLVYGQVYKGIISAELADGTEIEQKFIFAEKYNNMFVISEGVIVEYTEFKYDEESKKINIGDAMELVVSNDGTNLSWFVGEIEIIYELTEEKIQYKPILEEDAPIHLGFYYSKDKKQMIRIDYDLANPGSYVFGVNNRTSHIGNKYSALDTYISIIDNKNVLYEDNIYTLVEEIR